MATPKPLYRPDELMIFSTAKISCKLPDNKEGVGTGFFYIFQGEDYDYPVFVTNRHVVEGCVAGSFVISKMDESGKRIHNDQIPIGFRGFSDGWIVHPDKGVDLCMLPLAPYLADLEKQNISPFIVYNDKSTIPTQKEWREFRAVEKVTIVGYPDGIWQHVYNVPITTQGHTATPLAIDFYGSQFLINAAIYTGSSGSPVYLYDKEPKLVKENGDYILTQKPRVRLLGTASKVYAQTQKGKLLGDAIPIPSVVATTEVPMNLGEVIKSTRMLEFEPILREKDAQFKRGAH